MELENRSNVEGVFGGREGNGRILVRQDVNIGVDLDFQDLEILRINQRSILNNTLAIYEKILNILEFKHGFALQHLSDLHYNNCH